jgi:hypothetical protein
MAARHMSGGRPPNADLDDPEVVERICNRIASGEAISKICRDKDMPSVSTIYLKMHKDAEFRNIIALAREAQQEYEMDACIDIADAATPEDHNVAKLRIWARQWRAGKLAPKKFGEKLQIDQKTENTFVLRAPLPSETTDQWLTDYTPAAIASK